MSASAKFWAYKNGNHLEPVICAEAGSEGWASVTFWADEENSDDPKEESVCWRPRRIEELSALEEWMQALCTSGVANPPKPVTIGRLSLRVFSEAPRLVEVKVEDRMVVVGTVTVDMFGDCDDSAQVVTDLHRWVRKSVARLPLFHEGRHEQELDEIRQGVK